MHCHSAVIVLCKLYYNVKYGSTVSEILEDYKNSRKFKKLLQSVSFEYK